MTRVRVDYDPPAWWQFRWRITVTAETPAAILVIRRRCSKAALDNTLTTLLMAADDWMEGR